MHKTPFVRKVRGTDNEADMGTADLDGPTHQRLLQKLPLMPTQCRRLLRLIVTTDGVVKAQMSSNEVTSAKFSAQMVNVTLTALVTWVKMDAPRQKRQLEATGMRKTVERGTQTEFNLVNQITVPTNVCCAITRQRSAKGSRTCRWILSGGDVRACIANNETDKSGKRRQGCTGKTMNSLHLARSSVLHQPMQSSVTDR